MSDIYYYEYEKDDYYCYPGTYVLRNKLDIQEAKELSVAEREITSVRTAELIQNPPNGKMDFKYLKLLHKKLFFDLYDWAGKTRNVNISKGSQFCRCEFIESQMNEVMEKLKIENYLMGLDKESLSKRLAFFIGEINAIHPFREGNGRTQRLFIELLAKNAGFQLDFSKISKEDMLVASEQTFHRCYELMTKILFDALSVKV